MSDTTILLEDVSPHGTLKAIAEDDGRAVFFYIWAGGDHYFGMRACWVCNRRAAPQAMDRDAMQAGTAPMLEASACAHPQGLAAPKNLRVTWFEEGDGAALSDDKGILCIIPGWSGLNSFHGYARECTAENALCWPLPDDNVLRARVMKAEAFWEKWRGNAQWPAFKEHISAEWRRKMGAPVLEADISLGTFPPRVVQHFKTHDAWIATTVGMSIRRQPRVEMAMEDPSGAVRIELACSVQDETLLPPLTSWMQGTAGLPWNMFTWLGDGHTLPCSAVPGFPFMLLAAHSPQAPDVSLPDDTDGPRNILWLIPITAEERAIAEREGSGVLKEQLWKAGVTTRFVGR